MSNHIKMLLPLIVPQDCKSCGAGKMKLERFKFAYPSCGSDFVLN
jgi:hypothetical protein